ncbi:MAG: hypothetical protein MR286_07230 [Clostridiales bacterium]|nr:hypothetical protein [Clostridiales bacterium]
MDDEKRETSETSIPIPDENGVNAELSPAAMEDARKEMKNTLEHIVDDIAQNFSFVHELANTMGPALENFARMVQELSATMRPIVEAVQQAKASFAKAIADFQTPTVNEERKHKLIASYKKWGEYGWTLCPNAPFNYFDELPESIGAANNIMVPLCSRREMEQLFDALRSQRIKKEDLDAAILCYNNRQYKGCALILFGIIDAKLIRKQKRGETYRPSGSKAVKRLREQFEGGDNEKKLFIMLLCVNLFSCLETLFANANNFKIEPATINRNFVSHGMTCRPVRQRDCIQLFLALYNLMLFFKFTL